MGTRGAKRTKNYKIIRFVIFLMILGIIITGIVMIYKKPVKQVHFSIDDATLILQDIQYHEYDSIFDNPILQDLRNLHEDYGVVVTLYVFGELADYAIWDTSLTYKNEFRANADWLKIGFHSGSDLTPKQDYANIDEFAYKLRRTNSAICRLAGEESLSPVLRLHYWYAGDEEVGILKQEGITGLLCNDNEGGSYNLTKEQVLKLNTSRDGILRSNEITYYKTDIRLENVDEITEYLEEHKKDRMVVIFTHAWCFMDNAHKLKEAVLWFAEKEYQFTDLYTDKE